jgi:hypothetical protein
MVDGREQAIPMPNFNWQQIPEAKCIKWTGERVTAVLTCSGHVEFFRELAHPRPGVWELVDRFMGPAEHKLEWFFHFAPGLSLQLHEGEHVLTVLREGCPFLIMHMPSNGIRYQLRDTWYSYQYAFKQGNQGLHAQWQGGLEGEGVSFHWQFQLVNERRLPGEVTQVHLA